MKREYLVGLLESNKIQNNNGLGTELRALLGGQNSDIYFNVLPSIELAEFLLNNGLEPESFLRAVLGIYIRDYIDGSWQVDQKLAAHKLELIINAIRSGAKVPYIGWWIKDFSIEQLVAKTKALSPYKLYELATSVYPITFVDGVRKADPKQIEIQVKFMELAVGRGLNLDSIEYHQLTSVSPEAIIHLLDKGLHANLLLKAALGLGMDSFEDQIRLMDIAFAYGADLKSLSDDKEFSLPHIRLELLEHYKEKIIEVGPDILLIAAVSATSYHSPPHADKSLCAIALIRYAIDNGANVSSAGRAYGLNLLTVTGDLEVAKLLVAEGASCAEAALSETYEEFIAGGLQAVIGDPAIMLEQKYKNLGAPRMVEAKIPYILHHIWLSHPASPREILPDHLRIAIESKKPFDQAPVKWEHIVWTNDRALIPVSVKKLEEAGIMVRSIEDYPELSLLPIIRELINEKQWGKASDTLRQSVIERFGGVYSDLNYVFHRDLTDEAHKYDFFTQTCEGFYLENYFFAAKPYHPVTKNTLRLIERNLLNPPEYIARIEDKDDSHITDLATANPTYVAYYSEANKDGNVDIAYPRFQDRGVITHRDGVLITEHHDEYSQSDLLARHKQMMDVVCPGTQNPWVDIMLFLDDNEICGTAMHNIGYDSHEGSRSWVSGNSSEIGF